MPYLQFDWVELGFTGFFQVVDRYGEGILGFTRFYWVPIGFHGFRWVLKADTRLYWVLLGFAEF